VHGIGGRSADANAELKITASEKTSRLKFAVEAVEMRLKVCYAVGYVNLRTQLLKLGN